MKRKSSSDASPYLPIQYNQCGRINAPILSLCGPFILSCHRIAGIKAFPSIPAVQRKRGTDMRAMIAAAAMAVSLVPFGAVAQERVGDAALVLYPAPSCSARWGPSPALWWVIRQGLPLRAPGACGGTEDVTTGTTQDNRCPDMSPKAQATPLGSCVTVLLVPRFQSSRAFAPPSDANFGIKRGVANLCL